MHRLVQLCRDRVWPPMHPGQVYCEQHQSEGRRSRLCQQGQTDTQIRRSSGRHGIRRAGTGKAFVLIALVVVVVMFGLVLRG